MKYIGRLWTNIYTFLYAIRNRLFFRKSASNRVIIIADGLVGDTVLLLDFLKECRRFFCVEKGYDIDVFFSKEFVATFFNTCCDTEGINVLDIHYNQKDVSFKDLKNVLKFFKHRDYKILLNPHPKSKGDRISGCIEAERKITVRDDFWADNNFFNYCFRKVVYTDYTEVDKSVMEFERYKEILRICGDKGYKTSLPYIDRIESINKIPYQNYWVISTGSSENGKKMELEKYAEIVRYIWNHHHLPTVFVGAAADTKDADTIIKMVGKTIDCLNIAGETSYVEWVEVIRGAKFVIGNDSGSVHIAAAVETPSICVVGEWQYKRFYPYVLDNDSQYKPFIVNCGIELPCRNCGRDEKRICNEECRRRLKGGRSLKCIEMISEKSVIDMLESKIIHSI